MDTFTKEEIKKFTIGIIVLTLFMLSLGIFKYQHNTWEDAEDSDYTVYATFNRTDGLDIGDKVRMSGIDVGRVEGAVLDSDFRATLTLKIRKDISIPDDSSASIVSNSLMGSKYIEIEPGGSEDYIEENGEFTYTQDAIVLEELVDRIISLGKAKRKNQNCPAVPATNKTHLSATES